MLDRECHCVQSRYNDILHQYTYNYNDIGDHGIGTWGMETTYSHVTTVPCICHTIHFTRGSLHIAVNHYLRSAIPVQYGVIARDVEC